MGVWWVRIPVGGSVRNHKQLEDFLKHLQLRLDAKTVQQQPVKSNTKLFHRKPNNNFGERQQPQHRVDFNETFWWEMQSNVQRTKAVALWVLSQAHPDGAANWRVTFCVASPLYRFYRFFKCPFWFLYFSWCSGLIGTSRWTPLGRGPHLWHPDLDSGFCSPPGFEVVLLRRWC